MTLTSPGVESLKISTFVWNDALDLVADYGWKRAEKKASFGPSDERPDEFRYGWYQSMEAKDAQDLAEALRKLVNDNPDAPAPFTELAAFLESCQAEVKLEQ